MYYTNVKDSFDDITSYFTCEKTGHFLIINSDNYDVLQEVLQRLQADSNINCIYVSDFCYPNGLPDIDQAVSFGISCDNVAIIGLSQALMLQSRVALEAKVNELLNKSISGHGVIILEHCGQLLDNLIKKDLRLDRRIIDIEGDPSPLPLIKIADNSACCRGNFSVNGINRLLHYLERLSNDQLEKNQKIFVVSDIKTSAFEKSVFSITDSEGVYESISRLYPDVAASCNQNYGNEKQWQWLFSELEPYNNLSALVYNKFGTTANLSAHLISTIESNDDNLIWLLWLAIKAFGDSSNKYLSYSISKCKRFEELEEQLYEAIISLDINNGEYTKLYYERKHIISSLPENRSLVTKLCQKIGRFQKNAVYYLTDNTDIERYEFTRCLSIYDYTYEEMLEITSLVSPDLNTYLKDFRFDVSNTKLPADDTSFRDYLTDYFKAYKIQKLSNRISSEFLESVNENAIHRPYNKLQSRSSVVSRMKKARSQVFFFDALGVEYLSFIIEKCNEYGMISEVSIARCELPSITSKNKEFLQFFDDDSILKIDSLDEIKHHSKIYNYEKCSYPIHIFEELEIIDKELRKIHAQLIQGAFDKAIIVSDHGASRLAVLYGKEASATISLEESGEHSGRCCPSKDDPNIPFAAFEDGFSILANYERFRGGRRANVEVHGGASLEEVVVPILALSKKPENIELCFVDSVIMLKPRIIPELVLYSSVPMNSPRLLIDGDYYEGEFVSDNRHTKFSIPKLKRKGNYTAEVFDGERKLPIVLPFKVKKQTREIELF